MTPARMQQYHAYRLIELLFIITYSTGYYLLFIDCLKRLSSGPVGGLKTDAGQRQFKSSRVP